MAYAQLAGLPAYYGLYISFMPVMIAALWGSSLQFATGRVAVVSIMTATADQALEAIYQQLDAAADGEVYCPLRPGFKMENYQRVES